MFNIDWNKFAGWLLPSYLKKERMFAWVQVMLAALKNLYAQFMTFRVATRMQIAITNQTMVLEDELNKLLGLNKIVVIRNQVYQQNSNYIYYLSEASNIDIYSCFLNENVVEPTYSYLLTEQLSEFDFVVHAPVDASEQKITAFVDKYKLPDKTYKIETL